MYPVISIFDIGRTHKKFLLFNGEYKVIEETTVAIPDIKDEDGNACEDLEAISVWMKAQMERALQNPDYHINALNFSAHGASFVHLDKEGKPVTPLYDYMKPIADSVTTDFYQLFGGAAAFSVATSSPALNMLNSGIQLYWLKKAKPAYFKNTNVSLHLPQYGNYLFSGKKHADITSIGCHTGLWDFSRQHYHQWLQQEGVARLLPPAEPVSVFDQVRFGDKILPTGIGIHDSSAALLPFVYTADEPFLLLSSGTWNITLNPFFEGDLTEEDYTKDCLYYLLDINRKVASSRLFLGNEYDHQIKRLASWFEKDMDHVEVIPDENLFKVLLEKQAPERTFYPETMAGTGPFPDLHGRTPDLSLFSSFEEAYHQLMLDLTYLQKVSVELVCGPVKRLYVSGGFIRNTMFMELLQAFLPDWQLFIAENKRASALGAAVALHDVWQNQPLSEKVSPVIPFRKQLNVDLRGYKYPNSRTSSKINAD